MNKDKVYVGIDDDYYSGAVIVAESGADLSQKQIKQYGISVAPMHVSIGDMDLSDGAFAPQKIFDYFNETKKIPTTSAVSPGDYQELFLNLRKEYPKKYILHLCYSASTTATWRNAILVSEECEGIIHIDTKQVSAGQGAIVCKMAEWLCENDNANSSSIINYAERLIQKSHFAFIPNDLLYLKKGGRLSNVEFAGATILGIKPIIEIIDGKLVCTQKMRGKMEKVCIHMIDNIIQHNHLDRNNLVLLYSEGLNLEIRNAIESHLRMAGCTCPEWLSPGGVISCHSGPGAFGFGGFEKI